MKNEADHFDAMAIQWAEDPAALDRARSQLEVLEKLVPLHPGLTCLDVGGGIGFLSLLVADKTARVTVADLSRGMLDGLTRKISETSIRNVVPLLSDIGSEIPPGGPFGLVYAFMSFHHIPDTVKALSHVSAAQNPGGSLVIVDLETEDGSFHSHIPGFSGHNGFDTDTLARQADKAGYRTISNTPAKPIDKGGRSYPVFALLFERT